MFESLGLAGLLLPVGIALGWYLASRYGRPESRTHGSVKSEYLRGVAHLVNDDPDQAIAHFVKLMDVDDDTVETHLMLGSLFRKRGEVDRALRIHQNLIARPNLSPEHLNEARFELAQDYLKAGLLDGAEELFRELVAQGMYLDRSLAFLVSLHEQQREWPQAIEAAKRLAAVRGEAQGEVIAHYLCEQAQGAKNDGDLDSARKLVEKALRQDRNCVRASLLLAEILEAMERPAPAIKALQKVAEQDLRYFSEAIPHLERLFQHLGDADAYVEYLHKAETDFQSVDAVLARARLMVEEGLNPAPILTQQLAVAPSWPVVRMLLEQLPEDAEQREAAIERVRGVVLSELARQPGYLCSHCGLHPRILFWQCPSCKQWGSIAPSAGELRPS